MNLNSACASFPVFARIDFTACDVIDVDERWAQLLVLLLDRGQFDDSLPNLGENPQGTAILRSTTSDAEDCRRIPFA